MYVYCENIGCKEQTLLGGGGKLTSLLPHHFCPLIDPVFKGTERAAAIC